MKSWFLLIPITSAFTGWFVYWVIVKLIFRLKPTASAHPAMQHSFPDRVAVIMTEVLRDDFLSLEKITQKITDESNLEKIRPLLEEHIDFFLRVKLKERMPVVGMFIGDKTIMQLKDLFMNELQVLFPSVMENYMHELKQELDIQRIIKESVADYPAGKFEALIRQLLSKELGIASMLSIAIGFIIGVVEVLIIYFFAR